MRRSQRAQLRYIRRATVQIPSDVTGSYTGEPMTGANDQPPEDLNPVQDADDL